MGRKKREGQYLRKLQQVVATLKKSENTRNWQSSWETQQACKKHEKCPCPFRQTDRGIFTISLKFDTNVLTGRENPARLGCCANSAVKLHKIGYLDLCDLPFILNNCKLFLTFSRCFLCMTKRAGMNTVILALLLFYTLCAFSNKSCQQCCHIRRFRKKFEKQLLFGRRCA